MKKYNLLILFILLLCLGGVGGYFYLLDLIYENKVTEEKITSLKQLKQKVQEPIVVKADTKYLEQKRAEYEEILQKLELPGRVEIKDRFILINGAIESSYSYMMLKRLLNIVKNDNAKLESMCIGANCNEHKYGFFIKIAPYILKFG